MAIFTNINKLKTYNNLPGLDIEEIYDNINKLKYSFIDLVDGKDFFMDKIYLNKGTYALNQIYYTKERNAAFFEAHKKYIDVQIILSGCEIIDLAYNCIENYYNEESDLCKFCDLDINLYSQIVLKPNDVLIIYPNEAHRCAISMYENKTKVAKIVFKVFYDKEYNF